MQLGEWRKTAPNRESMTNAVLNVLRPVLSDLGAADDPECWVEWGEDPQSRYLVMVPTRAGLISTTVRVNTGTEGPRVTGKLVRWSRLQLSELSLESAAGHRIVAVQVDGQVLKGTNAAADRICEFVRGLIGAVDGRDLQFSRDGVPAPVQSSATHKLAASRTAARPAAKVGAKAGTKPAPKAASARPAAKAPATTRAAAAKAAASRPTTAAPKLVAPKPAPRAAAGSAAKPAARKRNSKIALIPALGPGSATRPVHEPAPVEPVRIAPHPIFAPVSAPPRGTTAAETDDWGDADSEERADRETRRPKTWTP
jgi:hypothetical protein